MRGNVAILGAGGFVGARYLEMAVLEGRTDVVPVIRAFRSLARTAHLGVPHRLGDASRPESLARAIAGCEAVVNLAVGDPSDILRTTQSVHTAAVAAGARVLVHLSSASVYGRVDRPDLPDDTRPQVGHWMQYARQKGLAENFLRERMTDGRLAIIVLRPGLVWGPGSPWVLHPAADLLSGAGYLVGNGDGICNLMYVDNLVRSVDAAISRTPPAPGFFNVADDETTTWRRYYGELAAGLGVDMATVHVVSGDSYRESIQDRVDLLQAHPLYKWLKDRLSLEARTEIKLRVARVAGRGGRFTRGSGEPVVTRALWELQTTRHPLPTAKFRATFGHRNQVSFAAGMAASLAWLRFIGVAQSSAGRELAAAPASAALERAPAR